MHHCVKLEIKFSTLCKKSRQERQEEVCCSVCRLLLCCQKNREKHEDDEHGRKTADAARQQRLLLAEDKPLVCLSCCKVFITGLFVKNDHCKNASHSKVGGTAHNLIVIPEWAVEKYLAPHDRKRSWDEANADIAGVDIMIHPVPDRTIEDSVPVPVQENSFTLKTSIQSILTKQRKTDLAEKRGRRVTFSPVTAVAFTSRQSIIQVGSQKTRGESSTDSAGTPETQTLSRKLHPGDSTRKEKEFPPSSNTPVSDSPFVPNLVATADAVFSPPLPNEGSNGSPMMTPQMSSTPVTDNAERRSLSGKETSQERTVPREGIFSSLANVICCAFQALPSVLTHFFATVNGTDENLQTSDTFGRHRRQRRRSATFTPYTSQWGKRRRLNQRNGQPLSPLPITKYLRSPRHRH